MFFTARIGPAVSGFVDAAVWAMRSSAMDVSTRHPGSRAAGEAIRDLVTGVLASRDPARSAARPLARLRSGRDDRRVPWGQTLGSAPITLALLRAVARGDLLLRRVGRGHILDQRLGHLLVGCVPVGDHMPGLAVPLHDAAVARALVVGAGDPHGAQHALEAQLLDAIGGQTEVLEAPTHLLAGQRLLAVLLLRLAHRLDAQH